MKLGPGSASFGIHNCTLFLALFLPTGCLWAQTASSTLRWHWCNPKPHGGNVVDMAYCESLGLGVQVAERGQIYISYDLDWWLPCDSFTTNALRGVTFLGSRILITGENGTVLYADDVNQFQPGELADGPTDCWLEAVAASTSLALAAGDNGYLCTSADGAVWHRQKSGTTVWFRGAGYGGGTFVVVGESGTIITSADGTNWIKRSSITSEDLNRVHFADGRFTAVGEKGIALSSTNGGTTWSFERTGATNALQCAVAGGAAWLVDGTREVRLRDNAIWSNELGRSGGPPDWTYYTAIGEPGYFLIAGHSGLQSEAYQTTPEAPWLWLTPQDSVRHWLWDIVRLPAFYAAAGDFGTILTSGNGVDWTLELVPSQVTNTTFLGIGGTSNLLVGVGDSGTIVYSPNIISNIVLTNAAGVVTQRVSSLGVVWHKVPNPPTTGDLQGVGVLSNSLFVVAGAKGDLFTSTDGTNWAPRSSKTTNFISCVTEWTGGLAASGSSGTLLTSKNGIDWTSLAMATTNWLYRVRWLNQQLVVVGQAGTILTSSDGRTWTPRASGTTAWLNDAAFIRDTWFVVGTKGTVLTSTDLVHWGNAGTITEKSLYGAATDSGQLVVVGIEGIILRSQVVRDLTPISFLSYARISTNGPPWCYGLYLFGGKPDQRFTLDHSTNLLDSAWVKGPVLEVNDGSGTLYYLDELADTNPPAAEYYRTSLVP